jgi:hypothetical protein
MGAHNQSKQQHSGNKTALARDPGDAGTINVDRSPHVVPLVSAGAETRTLARPTAQGDLCLLHFKTDGGDITLTVTGGYNEAGSTTIVFANAGEFALFIGCFDGTDYFWRLFSSSGIAANTLVSPGAALTAQLTTITHTAPSSEDFALQNLVQNTGFGFVTADEGNTTLKVIANLQTRLAEVEARLEAAGIVAAN